MKKYFGTICLMLAGLAGYCQSNVPEKTVYSMDKYNANIHEVPPPKIEYSPEELKYRTSISMYKNAPPVNSPAPPPKDATADGKDRNQSLLKEPK